MNTEDILKELSFYFMNFICHQLFIKEFGTILRKNVSGKEQRLFRQLVTQLENIKSFGRLVYRTDNNEQLKGKNGHYYSIHLESSQYNIRLLIYISNNNTPYFLSAFYERAGKRHTDYSGYISVLDERLRQLSEISGDDQNE